MLSRLRRSDDGSIAVLAAVTFPIVLMCVALATATIVWSASENETQRAADAAAVRAAATAFLGTDFPYQELPGVTTPLAYPDVDAIAAWADTTPPADLSECGTVGLPPVSLHEPGLDFDFGGGSLTVPVPGCAGVGPFAPPVALTAADSSRAVACETARNAMAPGTATYANRFHDGSGDSQPSCDPDPDGTKRINVKLATGSPLVGFGQYATDAVTGRLDTQPPAQLGALAEGLAAFGVRLNTALPSLLCPEISVTIDQPVREPVFDHSTAPNGRATARRIVKNAVVVPVYEGRAIQAATHGEVHAAAFGSGVDMSTSSGATVHIPPQNLNALLLERQQELLTLVDEIDAVIDSVVRDLNVSVEQLNGVYAGIDPTETQPPAVPATEPLEGLRVTKCLRDTLTQIYDPPSGDAPTAQEVMEQAAESGEQIVVVQVGAIRTACTAPGAIRAIPTVNADDGCIAAATTPRFDPTSGLYEVPFFDVTPVLVQDVGDGNFQSVPVHASQASGAFRGGLVRDAADDRYDPDVRQPVPTPQCDIEIPLPTPSTACEILSYSPRPLPTPTETPSPSLPIDLPPVPLPSPSPSPTPSESPTPTESPSSTCLLLPPLCPGSP